jgi:hypothetical protein
MHKYRCAAPHWGFDQLKRGGFCTPRKLASSYTPAAGFWFAQGVEVSAPPNIYPEFKPTRSLFAASDVPGFTDEVTTDKGITGYGEGGAGGAGGVAASMSTVAMASASCWRRTALRSGSPTSPGAAA